MTPLKRTPLKRGKPLRADPEKVKAWQDKSRKALRSTAPIKKINPKRIKKLRAQQFGSDGKREWILSLPSALTGRRHTDSDPMTPAHVGKTRAAGGGPEMMAPLKWSEHVDFDSAMRDQRFQDRYGVTREAVRQRARELELEWQRLKKGRE